MYFLDYLKSMQYNVLENNIVDDEANNTCPDDEFNSTTPISYSVPGEIRRETHILFSSFNNKFIVSIHCHRSVTDWRKQYSEPVSDHKMIWNMTHLGLAFAILMLILFTTIEIHDDDPKYAKLLCSYYLYGLRTASNLYPSCMRKLVVQCNQ